MLLTPNIAATLKANAADAARATPVCVVRMTATAAGIAAKKASWCETPRSRGLGRPSQVRAIKNPPRLEASIPTAGLGVGRYSSNPRCCGRISAAPVVRAPHPHDSTGRLSALFRRCVPETLTAQETRLVQPVPAARPSDISDDLPAVPVQIEFLTESHLLGRLQLVDAAVRILECEERRHIPFIDTLGANLKDGKPWATLHVFVAVGRGRLSGVSARSRSLITVSPLHAVPAAET